ncbi:hypothetical protein EJ110_NYTH53987 [Nymphaea thermarum]|nr:hypothetical protein EJ110_NYTH53981 [Nymphaea thermarum]KAF3774063.1 hypothetical protein EJ110_NYTH53987 [Nymphaea thermarum]
MFSVLWLLFCATDEYEEFHDEEDMHCAAQLAKMLDEFANDLRTKYPDEGLLQSNFLVEEMRVLVELKRIHLSNFLPQGAFLSLLREKVRRVSDLPTQYINKVWSYLEAVVLRVFMMHSKSYPLLQISVKRACQSVMNKMRTLSVERLMEMVEIEKIVAYTCNPEYRYTWSASRLLHTLLMNWVGKSETRLTFSHEYEEFPDEEDMHCAAQLAKMLDEFANDLRTKYPDEVLLQFNFLVEEMCVLVELKPIRLPNFLPQGAFLSLLREKVRRVSDLPTQFINKISVKRAAQSVMYKMKTLSLERLMEMVLIEKIVEYTCNPEYRYTWSILTSKQNDFMDKVKGGGGGNAQLVELAFDLKMRMVAYWKIVVMRLIDNVALHLLFAVRKLVTEELDARIIDHLVGPHLGGIERMLQESPALVNKRTQLNCSIQLLQEANDALSFIVDRVDAPTKEED